MKKMYRLLSMVLAVLLLATCFTGCNFGPVTAQAQSMYYVSMRINPEIELVVNEEGTVVAVNAINEDGETVLCKLELVGLSVEAAGEAFTAMATELGFIDVNTEEANVYIMADGENEEFIKDLEDKITEKINGFFDKKGIYGKVSPELAEKLEEFEVLAVEWNVSLKDARMISRILELYPELTVEEILDLDFEDWIELIKEDCHKNGLPAHMRDEYKEAVEAIKGEYSEMFTLMQELRELERQLRNKDLTEEERALIEAELDAKEEILDDLEDQYEDAIEALKEEKREAAKEIHHQIKEEAENRWGEFADKLKEHEDKFKEHREEIEDMIKDWRDSYEHDHDDDDDHDHDHDEPADAPADVPADAPVDAPADDYNQE